MEKLEELRVLLYTAIDSNKKEEILRLSQELDKAILETMRVLYVNKTDLKANSYS